MGQLSSVIKFAVRIHRHLLVKSLFSVRRLEAFPYSGVCRPPLASSELVIQESSYLENVARHLFALSENPEAVSRPHFFPLATSMHLTVQSGSRSQLFSEPWCNSRSLFLRLCLRLEDLHAVRLAGQMEPKKQTG